MPNSPSIKFKIENNNLEQTTPLVGVSCILARTKRGPYNDPSMLISTPSQFQSVFGSEIVPDGSPSNIEKALVGGSKLRIIRVPGAGYFKGILTANSSVPDTPEEAPSPVKVLELASGSHKVEIGFYTKTYDELVDGSVNFDAVFTKQGNTVFCNILGHGKTTVMESLPVITYKNADSNNNTTVDYLAFYQFLTGSAYLEAIIISSTLTNKSLAGVANWLYEEVDGSSSSFTFKVGTSEPTEDGTTCVSTPGNSGTAPTADQWVESLEYIRDYTDPYHICCSHIDQHLSTSSDQLKVHKAAKQMVDELDEYHYFIEVPKYTTHYSQGTTVRKKEGIIQWINTCLGTIGNSRNVAYFAGGIMMNNDQGIPVEADVLGTILGLADASGSNYGPWLSFAGMNRGVIYDGNGPACPNYGSPSRYNDLNDLAHVYANMIVVKDTSNAGKQTMLWHCFTSQVKQDSFKFISIVQLIHYLKKFLRPILESKIEEPNYIPTWQDIYLQVKPELDDLVEQEAMSEYTWIGDQNATGYDDMQVNKEADVRQGKYKAILKFKEIVPMQEIEMTLSIDKVARTASVELNS